MALGQRPLARVPPPPHWEKTKVRQRMDGDWYMWMGGPNHCGRGANIGRGGIGIYTQKDTESGKISISEPLQPDLRQTNSVAELWGGGGVQVLKRMPRDKLAILSDSDYLISGAQG